MVRIIDGDTIVVDIDGVEDRLRYIGMDALEATGGGSSAEQRLAAAATEANRELVRRKHVVLERDVSETDHFGRLLRHVWLERPSGWLLVNQELVRLGLAEAKSYAPDTKYDDLYDAAEQEAVSAGRGLWERAPDSNVSPTVSPRILPVVGLRDPAYPTVCIPSPPPDLDCGDIAFRRFAVLARDPHRFDGDFDGIGCESG